MDATSTSADRAAPVRFAIVGGGNRTALYLAIAETIPERFEAAVVVRNPVTAAVIAAKWRVPTFATIGEMARSYRPQFVVVAVPPAASAAVIDQVAGLGLAVLAETPVARTLDELDAVVSLARSGAPIQVAEPCRFRPLHAARRRAIELGWLGTVSHVQFSAAHGYHGVNLIRDALSVGCTRVSIRATASSSPLFYGGQGDDRAPAFLYGHPSSEEGGRSVLSRQVLAWLDFGDRSAVYDFSFDQYFSRIRSERVLIRGERGEVIDEHITCYRDGEPTAMHLSRVDDGQGDSIHDYRHRGIVAGGTWLYRNPHPPSSLSDDQLAAADCLERMATYLNTGIEFSSAADGAHDRYIELMIEAATQTTEPTVVTNRFA